MPGQRRPLFLDPEIGLNSLQIMIDPQRRVDLQLLMQDRLEVLLDAAIERRITILCRMSGVASRQTLFRDHIRTNHMQDTPAGTASAAASKTSSICAPVEKVRPSKKMYSTRRRSVR